MYSENEIKNIYQCTYTFNFSQINDINCQQISLETQNSDENSYKYSYRLKSINHLSMYFKLILKNNDQLITIKTSILFFYINYLRVNYS